MVKFLIIVLLILPLLAAPGCGGGAHQPSSGNQAAQSDSARVTAYKSLATASKTYTTTMQAVADLYRAGLVDDQVKTRAIAYGTVFKRAHDLALTAVAAGDYSSLADVTAALADLLEFVRPYLLKKEKV